MKRIVLGSLLSCMLMGQVFAAASSVSDNGLVARPELKKPEYNLKKAAGYALAYAAPSIVGCVGGFLMAKYLDPTHAYGLPTKGAERGAYFAAAVCFGNIILASANNPVDYIAAYERLTCEKGLDDEAIIANRAQAPKRAYQDAVLRACKNKCSKINRIEFAEEEITPAERAKAITAINSDRTALAEIDSINYNAQVGYRMATPFTVGAALLTVPLVAIVMFANSKH